MREAWRFLTLWNAEGEELNDRRNDTEQWPRLAVKAASLPQRSLMGALCLHADDPLTPPGRAKQQDPEKLPQETHTQLTNPPATDLG